MADLLNIENNITGHFIIDVDAVEPREEEEVDDTGDVVVNTAGAGAVATNTAAAGAVTAASGTSEMAVTTAGAGAVTIAGTTGSLAMNSAGAGAVTSARGGAAVVTAGAGAITSAGATFTGGVNTAGAGSVNSTGFGQATSTTTGAKGDAEDGGDRLPWMVGVLGGLAVGTAATAAALYRSPRGVSAHGGHPAYRFGIASVFAAGVAEMLAALWVSRDSKTRRAAGQKILYVSVVTLLLGVVLDSLAYMFK